MAAMLRRCTDNRQDTLKNVPGNSLPRHLAIIMDGNGRWARLKLLNRINGHRRGIDVASDTVRYCRELGIEYLTLYTFSRENWNRPATEVKLLMYLLETHLKEEEKTLLANNIRFKAIGNISELPESVRAVIDGLESSTRANNGMVLQLALSYSGREEITHACRTLAERVKAGVLNADDITEQMVSDALYTTPSPDPDLLIRTSGEKRISNFLLWQLAYTEIFITDVLWPDFTRTHLNEALEDYRGRERRFGLVKEAAGR